MDRNDLNREENARKKAIMIHYAVVILVTAVAMALSFGAWKIFGHGHGRVKHEVSSETVSIVADIPEEIEEYETEDKQTEEADTSDTIRKESAYDAVTKPTAEDGSGTAGIMVVDDSRTSSSGLLGWQTSSDGRRWYEVSKDACYYNGFKNIGENVYYFDPEGYAVVNSWYAVSYQKGCYFDESGAYVADRDNTKLVALTFDGGPGEYTSNILDLLLQYNAKATFFICGMSAEQAYGPNISRIMAEGHLIGNISYSNQDLSSASLDYIKEQYDRADAIIALYNNGAGASLVRFPEGAYTPVMAQVTNRPNIMWDLETHDRETEYGHEVAAFIFDDMHEGAVVHLHDSQRTAFEGLSEALPVLVSQGYEFVTVEQMAASRGYRLEDGVTYLGFTQDRVNSGTVNDR